MGIAWKPSKLTYPEIWEAARDFLERHHPPGDAPVPIEEIVEFDLGLELIPLDSYGVDAFLTSSLRHIYADEYTMVNVPDRFRFSLAHEIGHYVLHRGLYEEVSIERPLDWRQVQSDLGDNYTWVERQANSFAGLVLIPPYLLREQVTLQENRARAASYPPQMLWEGQGYDRLLHTLAEKFSVSRQPVEIRLSKDNYI